MCYLKLAHLGLNGRQVLVQQLGAQLQRTPSHLLNWQLIGGGNEPAEPAEPPQQQVCRNDECMCYL
jgi:hypothetical protein